MEPNRIDASGAVILDHSKKVLLVHQTYGDRKWTLPGGQREKEESPWQTVIRECKEEIGINIQLSDISLTGIYYLPHREAYQFVFRVHQWTGVPKPDENEIDQIGYFSVDQLPSPMSNFTIQRIQDALQQRKETIMREHHLKDYQLII